MVSLIKNLVLRYSLVFYFVIALALYLLFFSDLLKPSYSFWGSDAATQHYPARVFLYEYMVKEKVFPFWTERIFLGYPIYADMQLAFLNPINLIAIYFLGPVWSLKLLHFLSYFLGCFGFIYLARRNKYSLPAFAFALTTYFFCFFHINHLIHIHMVIITMLFPLHLGLAQLFFDKKKKLYIFLQGFSIAYAFLWGHPQVSMFLMLALYLFIFIAISETLKNKFLYSLAISLLAIGLSLHQYLPSFRMFLNGTRSTTNLDFADYSLTPESSLSFLYPYIYSSWNYYYGLKVSTAFTYVEFYNYVGIVGFVLLVVSIIFAKKDKLYWYSYSLIWLFIVLSYWNNIPVLRQLDFPLVTMFRYWTRSIILLSFSIALSAMRLFSFTDLDFSKAALRRGLLLLSLPITFLTLSHLIFIKDPVIQSVHASLLNLNMSLMLKKDILIWAVFPVIALSLYYLSLRYIKLRVVLVTAIVLLSLYDLYHFAQDMLPVRIMKWERLPRVRISSDFDGKRILLEKGIVENYQVLLYKAWTPYGYSMFLPQAYEDFFEKNNLGPKVRRSYESETIRSSLNTDILRRAGFDAIVLKNDVVYLESIPSINYAVLIKREGHFLFKTFADATTPVVFPVRFDDNWIVTINGERVKQQVGNELFTMLHLPSGEAFVEFRYFPFDMLIGLGGGLLLVLSTYLVVRRLC